MNDYALAARVFIGYGSEISGGMGSRPPTTLGTRKLESLGNHVALFA